MKNNRKKVLIVEDDQDIRESLGFFLESEGYRVEAAENGKEALRLLREASEVPGLVFLDLQMPVMSGEELLAEITQDAALSALKVPIVVFTAAARGAVSGPIVSAMKKPVDLDEILKVVVKYCGA